MSLPVSQYEALLAEVRGLRRKAQRVQQLATPLISNCSSNRPSSAQQDDDITFRTSPYTMEPLLTDRHHNACTSNYEGATATTSTEGDTTCSEDECGGARSTHMSVSSEPISNRDRGVPVLYHGTWPGERTMWNSDPSTLKSPAPAHNQIDVTSVMSFASSSGGVALDRVLGSPSLSRRSSQQLEAKVDMVYSLLAMLSGQEHADMGETLLALSTNPESCLAMRQSGCIPLLVQMVQSDKEMETRIKATQALHNLIHSQPDEKIRKREIRIFKLLEQTRAYTEALRTNKEFELEPTSSSSEDEDKHPVHTVAHLMKLSFDEGHRQAICQLGGIHIIASLVEVEHANHGSTADEAHCILMRRYACMALTNLTFGDSGNKALLCSFREFMRALVVQLQSPSDELRQVTASVLRNLSWRADTSSKEILREVGSVTGLMKSAMLDNKENTLKSILSALWNLSAHCTENKSEICSVDGALGFLVDMLTYKTPSKSLAIIENSGGILRNISSQIAVRDDYREVLRRHNCLEILLDQLKSPSLTIVSNACGTLWNLSAKCAADQEALWQMGAPTMLRSLNHSKHKMIAMGSSAALKNLLSARPAQALLPQMDATALAMDLPTLPTLGARKQKALLQDLDQNLSETYENIDKDSPVKVPTDDRHIPTNDFLQKSQKNKYNRKSASPEFIDDEYLLNSFGSINSNEPSTSSGHKLKSRIPQNCGSASLPYVETVKQSKIAVPVRRGEVESTPKCFVKSMPKNVAKNLSSANSHDNKSFSLYADSGLDQPTDDYSDFNSTDVENLPQLSINLNSSSGSIDNDRARKNDAKSKEFNGHLDEKDHCSIEDNSDGDNPPLGVDQTSYQNFEVVDRQNDVGYDTIGFESQKELPPPSVTNYEGSLDEIDMEDILIQLLPDDIAVEKSTQEEPTEKQDTGKEKSNLERVEENERDDGVMANEDEDVQNNRDALSKPLHTKSSSASYPLKQQSGPSCSGIPLPKSAPRPIPSTSNTHQNPSLLESPTNGYQQCDNYNDTRKPKKPNRLSSGLPRRSLQTSTPIRINLNDSSGGGNSSKDFADEALKVQNNDADRDHSVPVYLAMSGDLTTSLECSFPVNNCFSGQSISAIEQTGKLNISLENNSQMDKIGSLVGEEPSNKLEEESEILPSPPTDESPDYSYPGSENCVNFAVKDDRDRLLERSCEEMNLLDNRMLDPDAMIESLDRFTAELVSQASHLQSKEDYKDNTWNDDTSPNEVTFPSISGSAPNVITFDSNCDSLNHSNKVEQEEVDGNEKERESNDFSSINTSTMTESTLIAIEATKMATVFKIEAEMSHSITSVASLELDQIQPPSQLCSLSHSSERLKSPRLISRKKSLPVGLMVRRALSNSLNNASSLESLENHSFSNLDQMNPPSGMGEVFDMEGSMTSVASLPSETRTDFVISGVVSANNPMLSTKQPLSLLPMNLNSFSDLENVNPPSLFQEITDMCNSLADVPTEAIGSETEIFEDCFTHVVDPPVQTEDDVTEFSDANSATPLQSDLGSSPETSPKKIKSVKQMTSKQRRNLARDRYKTYTVAAEMVMKEEEEKLRSKGDSTSDDFKTVECFSEDYKSIDDSETTYVSPTYSVKSSRTTPKERRQNDRSRFETQVVNEAITDVLRQPVIGETPPDSPGSNSSPVLSPARTKLGVRRNFIQKRLENKERFRTQTLSESSFSPDLSSASPPVSGEPDLHLLVQKEANLVLKSLRETKTSIGDELLDCETLSLVSNDDDSEHNSGSSINYRTYHKSWGLRKNIPVVAAPQERDPVDCVPSNLLSDPQAPLDRLSPDRANSDDENENEEQTAGKPKIVKPAEKIEQPPEAVEECKGIRGRRKPLYAKSSIASKIAPKSLKPIKTMTSNLVKNVTSTLRSGSVLKTVVNKPPTPKPPTSRVSSGYGSKSNSPKTSPARVANARNTPKLPPRPAPKTASPALERQGTFTKDDPPKSRIPTTRIPVKPAKLPSRIPAKNSVNNGNKPAALSRNGFVKSASSDRANRNIKTTYTRSTSADSGNAAKRIQTSTSSQSLKGQNGAVKRSSIPQVAQRSSSNTSLNSNGSTSARKQVTSKIASLWKKIEESKSKQPAKKDTRVWIQGQEPEVPPLVRSNTFDNKDEVVTLRNRTQGGDEVKRISRLGSFIVMDESEDGVRLQQVINATVGD